MWSYVAPDRQRRGTCPLLRGSLLIFFRSINCRLLWSEAEPPPTKKKVNSFASLIQNERKQREREREGEKSGERENVVRGPLAFLLST